ncbi:MAG: hypothetical protein HOW73_50575 [Polyangiaceae bacterium]|nr:hypothetical protein [Polyangiaceae bacterium]
MTPPAPIARRRRTTNVVLVWLAAAIPLAACVAADEAMEDEDAAEAFAALEDPSGPDPCAGVSPNAASKGVTVQQLGNNRALIIGTDEGDDISGTDGEDIICAFRGRDTIRGGNGDDYIDGGSGNDEIYGDAGRDTIHGRGGGDEIHGGAGNDRLFGDILDDKMWGDDGDDLLIGAHGADYMHGGPGDDWLRGDTNTDSLIGGEGSDTASFTTAMPPGQPQDVNGAPNPTNGIVIDFAAQTASGDGYAEPLEGVERVVGSPFNDQFLHVGARKVIPGFGSDTCDGAACGGQSPAVRAEPFVFLTDESFDTGLMVMGTSDSDKLRVHGNGSDAVVSSIDGATIDAGPGCTHVDATHTSVRCGFGGNPLRYVLGWGDLGDDRFVVEGHWPRDITVHVDGGEGSDTIIGGDEEDVFFTGRRGADVLEGNGGDDALISESYKADLDLRGSAYPGGADILKAGDGDDQLVVDYPCGGHFYSGGSGIDVAGFARAGNRPLTAQLDGQFDGPAHRQEFVGRAFSDLCASDWQTYGTHMEGNLEILEGTDGADRLHGNDGKNTIWGREGDDAIYGYGGDDILEGLRDNDSIWAGAGRDVVNGGAGVDHIYAGDGTTDIKISCGEDGGVIESRDAKDPAAEGCHAPSGGGATGGGGGGSGGSGSNGGSDPTPGCSGDDFPLADQPDTHCYRIITARTWDQARTQCQDVGKHLATLTIEENARLRQSGHIDTATWIGGHREGATTQFYWVTESESFPMNNAPWNDPGEAHDAQGDKCVTFLVDGTWGLKPCDATVQALCEDF